MARLSISESLTQAILPGYRTGHTRYVDRVKELFRDGCHWLDAGGGRRIFHDLYDGERELVARAGRVVACDVDQSSLDDHVSVTERVVCDLSSIPLPDDSFDLITCGMVVEHLSDPGPCMAELRRVLRPGGRLAIHTVNLYGYPTMMALASKVLPFRRHLIAWVTGRLEKDIFPTHYRCNTVRAFRRHLGSAGLRVERIERWNSGLIFRSIAPLALAESLYIRATSVGVLAPFRGQLFVVATK